MNIQSPSPESSHVSLSFLSDAVKGDYPGVRELYETQFDWGDNRFIHRLLAEPPRGFYFYLPRNYQASNLLFLEDYLKGDRKGNLHPESHCAGRGGECRHLGAGGIGGGALFP